MITERIQCTDDDLRAGYHRLGLLTTSQPLPNEPQSFATCDLVDEKGALTATAEMILPLLASPRRLVTVSATTAGSEQVDLTTIMAPIHGGPFVLRGDGTERSTSSCSTRPPR